MSNHCNTLRWRPRDRMEFLSKPWLQPKVISAHRPLFLRLNHHVSRLNGGRQRFAAHEPGGLLDRCHPCTEKVGTPQA